MPPLALLLTLLLLTLAAWIVDRLWHSQAAVVYRQLAVTHGMHYSPGDPLRLTPRIAALLPIPGAASVRIIDLFYRTDQDTHYYVFTAEYTAGVIGPKCRYRQVAAFNESKFTGSRPELVHMGDPGLSLVEQYQNAFSGNAASARPSEARIGGSQ